MKYLKHIQKWTELILTLSLSYFFFFNLSSSNMLVFFFKFCFGVLLIYLIMYWINEGLTRIRRYIEDHYLDWLRKDRDTRHSIKYEVYGNNLFANVLIFIINIWIKKTKYMYSILHFMKFNILSTIIIFLFIFAFLIILYLVL